MSPCLDFGSYLVTPSWSGVINSTLCSDYPSTKNENAPRTIPAGVANKDANKLNMGPIMTWTKIGRTTRIKDANATLRCH